MEDEDRSEKGRTKSLCSVIHTPLLCKGEQQMVKRGKKRGKRQNEEKLSMGRVFLHEKAAY